MNIKIPKEIYEKNRDSFDLLNNLGWSRVEYLRVIHKHKPRSLYQLHKILGRSLSSIHGSLKNLEKIGLIRYETGGVGKRKTNIPVLNFTPKKLVIDLGFEVNDGCSEDTGCGAGED